MKVHLFIKRIGKVIKALLFLAPFILILAFSIRNIFDLDIWVHLKTGEYFLKNLQFVRSDFYSYTAEGNLWLNPHWLFQLSIYLIHRFWGFAGIIIVKTLLIISSFIVLFRIGYRRESYLWNVIVFLIAILAAKDRFYERPEFVSFLFIAVYLALIYSYRYKRTKFIFILPFLQILWTNLHAFSFVGLGIIAVFLVGDFISWKVVLPQDWNKNRAVLKGKDYFVFLKVFLLCILASVINPFGIKIFGFSVYLLRFIANHREILAGGISELIPPFYRTHILAPGLFYYKVLVAITLATFIIRYKRIDFSQLLLFLVFFHLSIAAIRNIVLFSMISYAICMDNINDFPVYFRRLPATRFFNFLRFLTRAAIAVYVFGLVFFTAREEVLFSYYLGGRLEKKFGLHASAFYPEKAVDFILKNGIKGNIFNSFGFGSYFIYRCYPERKVFIDGRTSVYGDDFLRYYADVHLYPALFQHMLDRYRIDYFLLDINSGGLFKRLYTDRENWRLVFFDYTGAVFVKNIPENNNLIERYEVDLENLPLDPAGDYSHMKRRPFPTSCFAKGELFLSLGLNRRAEEEYLLGLRINSKAAGLYNNIGTIYQKEGKLEEAISLYKKARELDPRLVNTSLNLGSIYQARGEMEKALEIYKGILPPFNMPNAFVYNNIGEIYRQKGLLRKSLANYDRAIALEPSQYEFYYNRGLVLVDMGEIQLALDSFRKARDLQPELAIIYNNLGACYMTLGKYERAEEEFRRALDIESDLAEAKSNLEKLKKLMEEHQSTGAPERQKN